MRQWNTSPLVAHVAALVITALAVGLRGVLQPWLGESVPYITMFAAVAICAGVLGNGPALLATVTGGIGCTLLFLGSGAATASPQVGTALVMLVYASVCLLIILMGDQVRRRGGQAESATRRLRESESLLQQIVDAMPMLVSYIGPDLRYGFNNRAYRTWFGQDLDQVRGHHVREVLGDAAFERVRPSMERALAGERVEFETALEYRGAGRREVAIIYQPHRVGDEVRGFFVLVEDISERRRAEAARAHLAAIFESADDAVVSKTLEGRITSWNSGAERLFGYSADEMIGTSVERLIPDDLKSEEQVILEKLRRGERIRHFETERVSKDGRRIPVSLTVSPIYDAAGQVVGASKIARDVSERKQAERRIAETDRRKDEFLATLAHELRNPLAPILNSAQFLRARAEEVPAVANASEIIERQARHMSHLVDDLLDVSRVSRGHVVLRRENLSLPLAVSAAVEAIRPALDAAGHTLEVHLPSEPLHVHGDLTRLSQVFGNLLGNAVKYTPRGGRITLDVEADGDVAQVRVRDTGVGIAPEMHELVFEMFAQVDDSLERRQGGLGIGLTLARELVRMHEGTLGLSSAPGQGSEFVVRLPRAEAPPSAAEGADASQGDATTPLRVLLVDDSDDVRRSLALMLEMEGHEVHTASDGLQGVEAAERLQPDVVLMDIGMPHLNGYDAARRIRALPDGKGLRMIALTGWGQEDDRRRALDAGFDEHWTKPVEYHVLKHALASARPRRRRLA